MCPYGSKCLYGYWAGVCLCVGADDGWGKVYREDFQVTLLYLIRFKIGLRGHFTTVFWKDIDAKRTHEVFAVGNVRVHVISYPWPHYFCHYVDLSP